MRHIRRYIRQPEPRRFYDFLVQDHIRQAAASDAKGPNTDPPGAA
jgi:hypothetical protein